MKKEKREKKKKNHRCSIKINAIFICLETDERKTNKITNNITNKLWQQE